MMVRYFCLFIFLLFLHPLSGQIHLGPYASGDNASFSGEGPRGVSFYFGRGFLVGVKAKFSLTDEIRLSVEPAYFQGNNGILEADTLDADVIYDHKVINRGLSIPLKLNVRITDRWYAVGGFSAAFFLSTELERFDETIDLDREFASYNLSALFGIGYALPIQSSQLEFEFTYLQGLNNLATDPTDTSLMRRVRITSMQLSIGYLLPLTKS